MCCALFCRATVATEHLLRGLLRHTRANKPFAWKTAVIVEIYHYNMCFSMTIFKLKYDQDSESNACEASVRSECCLVG